MQVDEGREEDEGRDDSQGGDALSSHDLHSAIGDVLRERRCASIGNMVDIH